MRIIIIFLLLVISINGQSVRLGIPGVTPLKTSRNQFEKRYGAPLDKNPDNKVYRYQTRDLNIEVTYTGRSCSGEGRNSYNVPEFTVFYLSVSFKSDIQLSQLLFDERLFVKDQSGDMQNVYQYINPRAGVTIEVVEPGGRGWLIRNIYYYKSKKNENRHKCVAIEN